MNSSKYYKLDRDKGQHTSFPKHESDDLPPLPPFPPLPPLLVDGIWTFSIPLLVDGLGSWSDSSRGTGRSSSTELDSSLGAGVRLLAERDLASRADLDLRLGVLGVAFPCAKTSLHKFVRN